MRYKPNPFYVSPEWRRLRKQVLASDRGECLDCRRRGYYNKANTVHHVMHLDKHPELALSVEYVDSDGQTQRNLVSLCHECHEARHGYRRKDGGHPLTKEWW